MADKVTTMRVPEEVLEYFDDVAELNEESRTDVMRRALIVGYETMRKSYSDLDDPVKGAILRTFLGSEGFLRLLGDDPKHAREVAERVKRRIKNRRVLRGKPA